MTAGNITGVTPVAALTASASTPIATGTEVEDTPTAACADTAVDARCQGRNTAYVGVAAVLGLDQLSAAIQHGDPNTIDIAKIELTILKHPPKSPLAVPMKRS